MMLSCVLSRRIPLVSSRILHTSIKHIVSPTLINSNHSISPTSVKLNPVVLTRKMSTSCTPMCSHMARAKKILDRSKYRYYPEDFGALQTRSLHLDLTFDFTETRALVTSLGTYYHCTDDKSELKVLKLDSNGLEIVKVEFLSNANGIFTPVSLNLASNDWDKHVASVKDQTYINLTDVTADAKPKDKESGVGLEPSPLPGFVVDKEDTKLLITLPESIPYGAQFIVRTTTIARPTANVLEGLYYDYTPEGCPQTIITQCQQYGFQRIVPSIDQMPSKMCYTTTIIADGQYSSFITNGDLAPGFFTIDEHGLPVAKYQPAPTPAPADVSPDLASRRMMLQYRNWSVPMATYLFFLGIGSYIAYARDVEYPDGDKFQIELLVFPGLVDPVNSVSALKSLHDSIIWTYLSLGEEICEHNQERARIYELLEKREMLKSRLDANVHAVISSASPDHPNAAAARDSISPEQLKLPAVYPQGSAEYEAAVAELAAVRSELKKLIGAWKHTGYKYNAQTYREIAMINSNYGGMENVGNTTIIAKMIAPSEYITDKEYVYMEGVKVHEFYHNINGSQVTGQSPFQIWLNEAVTVFAQRIREDDLFGHSYMRLGHVQYALTPATGPLAIDESPNSMAIEPEGFNTTHELISAMTYSKAPEFIRMVAMILGEAKFHKALAHYHSKFAHGNATTEEWLECMQEESPRDLKQMAAGWLNRTGHPRLHYTTSYDAASKKYTINLTQKGFETHAEPIPWEFPVDWSLVKQGKVVKEGVYIFDKAEGSIVISDVDTKPDFASVARDWSFFGRIINDNNDIEETKLQALSDPDTVNRMFSYQVIADATKSKCIDAILNGDQDYVVDEEFINLHGAVLFDNTMSPSTRQAIVGITESTTDSKQEHFYWALSDARIALSQAVVRKYHDRIIELLKEYNADSYMTGAHITAMHQRALKAHLISLLAAAYYYKPLFGTAITPKIDLFDMCVDLFNKSSFMSDKVVAVSVGFNAPTTVVSDAKPEYLSEKHRPIAQPVDSVVSVEKKKKFLELVKSKFITHPDSLSTYIALVASVGSDQVCQYIRDLTAEPFFKFELSGHARTVARCWTAQRKRSILTKQGLELTSELTVKIGVVNQMSAYALLQAFGDMNKFEPEVKSQIVAVLKDLQSKLDKHEQQSLYNNISRMLESANKTQ